MKYTLEELNEIINDPNFDYEAYGNKVKPTYVMKFILDAIEFHKEISNDNNAEHH